jgi:hypothetical protein
MNVGVSDVGLFTETHVRRMTESGSHERHGAASEVLPVGVSVQLGLRAMQVCESASAVRCV